MENNRLNPSALSLRQLSVGVLVAGLSAGAAAVGRVDWVWVLIWSAAAVVVGALLLNYWKGRVLFCGISGTVLAIIYKVWSVILAARALGQMTRRLEQTSGNSGIRLWLILLTGVVLLLLCRLKPAGFYRAAELLWLGVAVLLLLLLLFGVRKAEWRYLTPRLDGWDKGAMAALDIFAPALFVAPYLYKVEEMGPKRKGVIWLAGLGLIGGVMAAMTRGIFGQAVELLEHPFFAAMGVLGTSSRWEGTISVLWAVPNLVYAGLMCRVWGGKRGAIIAGMLSVLIAATEILKGFPVVLYPLGTVLLLLLTLALGGKRGKIVVEF